MSYKPRHAARDRLKNPCAGLHSTLNSTADWAWENAIGAVVRQFSRDASGGCDWHARFSFAERRTIVSGRN
jgi:hypothetical protein